MISMSQDNCVDLRWPRSPWLTFRNALLEPAISFVDQYGCLNLIDVTQ